MSHLIRWNICRRYYSLKSRLQVDMMTSLKNKEIMKSSVLKQLYAELVKSEKSTSEIKPDEISTIQKCAQRWKDTIEEYQKMTFQITNQEQIEKIKKAMDKESLELSIIEGYLPEPYGKDQLEEFIKNAMLEMEGTSSNLTIAAKTGIIMKKLVGTLENGRLNKKELVQLVTKMLTNNHDTTIKQS